MDPNENESSQQVAHMTKTIKAKYANGVITPLEPLDLADDTVLLLRVEELESPGQSGGRAEETAQERAERMRRVLAKGLQCNHPTADIDQMLREIADGYVMR